MLATVHVWLWGLYLVNRLPVDCMEQREATIDKSDFDNVGVELFPATRHKPVVGEDFREAGRREGQAGPGPARRLHQRRSQRQEPGVGVMWHMTEFALALAAVSAFIWVVEYVF